MPADSATSFVATSTPIYGAFATVIGVISVLVLTSNGLVLALEISVVRAWQLWPRGIDIHLLFPADERAYVLLSLMAHCLIAKQRPATASPCEPPAATAAATRR